MISARMHEVVQSAWEPTTCLGLSWLVASMNLKPQWCMMHEVILDHQVLVIFSDLEASHEIRQQTVMLLMSGDAVNF